MRRIMITLGYDGTAYAGWQRQKNGIAVQEVVEGALDKLFHENTRLQGSGRTDAGVHARGQVAAFDLAHDIDLRSLVLALNANLPDDIRVYGAEEAAPDFHPQFHAKKKTYRYRFYDGEVLPPELRAFCTLPGWKVDWDAVADACPIFVGERDFAACCASGATTQTSIRTVYSCRLLRGEEGAHIMTLEVCGSGFLYNMVRIIAGTLLEVGKGTMTPDEVREALASLSRENMGPTAPAKGLTLWSVEYE